LAIEFVGRWGRAFGIHYGECFLDQLAQAGIMLGREVAITSG
jgi:hypothetical protein